MHNIFSVNSIYNFSIYSISILEDRMLSSWTAQQKRILLVASVALSCLAIGYVIYRQCYFKAKVLPEDQVGDDAILSQASLAIAAKLHDHEKSKAIPLNDKLAMAKRAGALLTSLDLEDTTVTDQELKEVMEACPNLKILNLHKCRQLTDEAMKYLPKELEELDISRCYQLKDEAIKNLPRGLKKVDLSGCQGLTDATIKLLPENLESLNLTYCEQFTGAGAKDLPLNLKTLIMKPSLAFVIGIQIDVKCINPDNIINLLALPADLAAQLHDSKQSIDIPLTTKLAMAKRAGALLTSLDLEDTTVTDQELKEVMEACPNLKALDLHKCHKLTDVAMKFLPKELKTLRLSHCYRLTDEAIKNLPRELKRLDLTHCKGLTDAAIKYLPENLEDLDLSYCEQFTDAAIEGKILPKDLKSLHLSHCNGLTNAVIQDLPRNLAHLDLSYCKQITEAAAKDLPPNLKGLIVEPGSRLSAGTMKEPIGATVLNADFLRPISSQDPADLAAQLHDPEQSEKIPLDKKLTMAKRAGALLTSLNLGMLGIKDQQLKEVLEACPNLKVLNLRWNHSLTDAVILKLPKDLQYLDLSWCSDLTNEAIEHLPQNLVSLYLEGCDRMTVEGMNDLPKNLQVFGPPTFITDEVIKVLPRSLKHLDLTDCKNLSDAAMRDLPEELEILVLTGCNRLTDNAIKNLPRNIQELDLSWCDQLTDEALKDLPKHLEKLNIHKCKQFSDANLKNLPTHIEVIRGLGS